MVTVKMGSRVKVEDDLSFRFRATSKDRFRVKIRVRSDLGSGISVTGVSVFD